MLVPSKASASRTFILFTWTHKHQLAGWYAQVSFESLPLLQSQKTARIATCSDIVVLAFAHTNPTSVYSSCSLSSVDFLVAFVPEPASSIQRLISALRACSFFFSFLFFFFFLNSCVICTLLWWCYDAGESNWLQTIASQQIVQSGAWFKK